MSRKVKPIPVKIVHDASTEVARPYVEKDRMHMSVRQIENGYVVNRHGYKDGKHFDEEVFTPNVPNFGFPTRKPPAPPAQARGSTRHEPTRKPASKPAAEKKVSGFMTTDTYMPKTVAKKHPLNVPSDAPLPQLKRARNARLSKASL